jgi:hypothetical protein
VIYVFTGLIWGIAVHAMCAAFERRGWEFSKRFAVASLIGLPGWLLLTVFAVWLDRHIA